MFTQRQKKNLFCKCVKLSFPASHLLLYTVNSRESPSAVRQMRRSPPCMNFCLSAHYTINGTNVCFPVKYTNGIIFQISYQKVGFRPYQGMRTGWIYQTLEIKPNTPEQTIQNTFTDTSLVQPGGKHKLSGEISWLWCLNE